MNGMEKYTIILLAFNDENTIERCIQSIKNQSHLGEFDLEVLFIPNGCSDKTEIVGIKALTELIRVFPNIVYKVLSLKKGHRNKAINKGIKSANGNYIFYLNADCFFADNKTISYLFNEIKKDSISIVGAIDLPDYSLINKNTLLFKVAVMLYELDKLRDRIIPNGRFLGFKKNFIMKFPENIHSEDNWIGFKTFGDLGEKAISTGGEIRYDFYNTWDELIKTFTRHFLGTKQVLESFPQLNETFNHIKQLKETKNPNEDILPKLLNNLKKHGFTKYDVEEFYNLKKYVDLIIQDNVYIQKGKLINNDGTWDSSSR
jgi:glycosyltransferase involved in cell wall biosynthesis